MKLLSSKIYVSDIVKALESIDLSFITGKTILITGGLGLIGSAIVDTLLVYNDVTNAHISIYIADINKDLFYKKYDRINGLNFIKYDAIQPIDFNYVFDYIVCGAGLASPELYTSKPVETILSNINGIINLLNYSKTNLEKRLIYISSSEVYGVKESEESFLEGIYGKIDIDNLRSSYSVAKRASEMICRSYVSEYGIDAVIVRPGHIYGPGASKNDSRVSSLFAYNAAQNERIVLKSSGIQQRSYVYSLDCAVAILTVMNKGKIGEAYNIANDDKKSIREMAEIYSQIGKVELVVSDPTNEELCAFNPMNNSTLNNEKLKQIGYKQIFTAEEGFIHTVQILRELSNNQSV